MPNFFGSGSPFDKLVEKATNETNNLEDWGLILECCDFINSQQNTRPTECFRSILRRVMHAHPNVAIQGVIVMDACVSNCGKKFHLELASREFETEIRKLLTKGHPKVIEKMRLLLKKWADNEFKSDPQLALIPAFVKQLKTEGYDFTDPSKPPIPKDPNVVTSEEEQEDIIKAIEASLRETRGPPRQSLGSSGTNTSALNGNSTNSAAISNSNMTTTNTVRSLYPDISAAAANVALTTQSSTTTDKSSTDMRNGTTGSPADKKEPFKVRALYDFEAAEENELTFKAGEVILVSDSSDENWWSGSNHRGDGFFPANFVTTELDATPKESEERNVKFNDDIKVVEYVEEPEIIDTIKIDRLLQLLHEADPTGTKPDSEELLRLEEKCKKMGDLIDRELQRLDRKHVALSTVNRSLTEAMRMYLYLNI